MRRGLLRAAMPLLLAAFLAAQPQQLERRDFARVQELRRRLLQELRGAEPTMLAGVAEDLARPPQGMPFSPLAHALARLRGVKPDPEFLFRHALQVHAMPEVVDGEVFTFASVTLHLSYPVEEAGDVEFKITVRDHRSRVAWRGEISQNTAMEDLLRFRATVRVPVAKLPDGRYEVEVDTLLGGVPPRPADSRTRTSFFVSRGFKERMSALGEGLLRLRKRPGVSPSRLAMLTGRMTELSAVLAGEPAAGPSHALANLRGTERMLARFEKGEPLLEEESGWMRIGVPVGDAQILVRLRLDDKRRQRRPLVLFVPGPPAYGAEWARPTSPLSTAPGFTAATLVDFDAGQRFHVAVMESPGRVANIVQAVGEVVSALQQVFAVAAGKIVLVGEREGAMAVLGAALRDPKMARGLVLVCGGALSREDAKRLAGRVKVLGVPGTGHPANFNLLHLPRVPGLELRMLGEEARPWMLALPLAGPAIEEFVAAL